MPKRKLDGTIVTIVPLNLIVSILRDRIIVTTGSVLLVGRLILLYNGKQTGSSGDDNHNAMTTKTKGRGR